MTTEEQIKAIQIEMAKTPYHKGTEGWFGLMRAKLARLKDRMVDAQARGGGGGGGFSVRQGGNATVVLVGFPSVGKSTLLNKLTNAKSPTAEYAFTTVSVIPGMMNFNGAQIQIMDVPGLIEGASRGSGRGREVLSVVRGADLLLIMVEVGREEEQIEKIMAELSENGVRVNQTRPKVEVRKTLRGGLKINSTVTQALDRETIKSVGTEFGVINAEIIIKEKLTLDRLIDSFAINRVYTPALYIVNKIDKKSPEVQAPFHLPGGVDSPRDDYLRISAEKEVGLDVLREKIWETLGLVRVYLRPKGLASQLEPLIVHYGQTLQNVLDAISREMAVDKTEAKIWGNGARFPGQTVSLETKVQDGMEVMFV